MFARLLFILVKLGAGVARSIELGVMPLTPGTGRVSVTVSAALPIRLKVGALPVCCQTWAWTGPTSKQHTSEVQSRPHVGYGPLIVKTQRAAARAVCSSRVAPRTLTIGRP